MNTIIWAAEDLEQISCDLCAGSESHDLYRRPDGLQVVECVSCKLAFLNPRPKPEFVFRFYDQSYYQKQGTGDTNVGYAADYFDEANRQTMISAAETKLRLLEPFWSSAGRRCLEVGCATGEFTSVLSRHGATAVGLDLSEFVIRRARQAYPGIDFRVGGVEDIQEASSFDAIFGFEVIEHVLSPSLFLASAGRVLKPAGLLVLTTPNLASGVSVGFEKWLGFHTSL